MTVFLAANLYIVADHFYVLSHLPSYQGLVNLHGCALCIFAIHVYACCFVSADLESWTEMYVLSWNSSWIQLKFLSLLLVDQMKEVIVFLKSKNPCWLEVIPIRKTVFSGNNSRYMYWVLFCTAGCFTRLSCLTYSSIWRN